MNPLIQRGSLFDQLFNELSPGFFIRPMHNDSLPGPAQIRLDVKESERDYTVTAELPGVARDDIQVTIDAGLVTISAEIKQQDSKTEGERIVRSERYYGKVTRAIGLPNEIDKTQAKAKFEDGLLNLSLPKQSAGSAHRLSID